MRWSGKVSLRDGILFKEWQEVSFSTNIYWMQQEGVWHVWEKKKDQQVQLECSELHGKQDWDHRDASAASWKDSEAEQGVCVLL